MPLLFFNRNGTRLFIAGLRYYVVDVATGRTFTWSDERFSRAALADKSRVPDEAGGPAVWVRPDGYLFGVPEGNDVRLLRFEGELEFDEVFERSSLIRVLRGHSQSITDMTSSEVGLRLVTGSLDGTARVWNAASGGAVFTSPVETSDVEGVAFDADESRVTVIYSNGRIVLHAITLDA